MPDLAQLLQYHLWLCLCVQISALILSTDLELTSLTDGSAVLGWAASNGAPSFLFPPC